MTTFTPPRGADVGGKMTPRHRVLIADFGDGYKMRAKDTLNHVVNEFSYSWSALTDSEAATMLNYFNGLGSVEAFLWTPPGFSSPMKFITKNPPAVNQKSWNNNEITVHFEQVFDL